MADLVTTAEVQTYLGIDNEDDLIEALITGYQDAVRKYTGLQFTQESITEYIDGDGTDLIVRRPPIDSVTGVYDHYDDDDEVDSDDYTFNPETGSIFYDEGSLSSWGTGRRRWKVVYVGDLDGAPEAVKLAMYMLIAKTVSNRDPSLTSERIGGYAYTRSADSLPSEVKLLLDQYRARGWF